ncbi:GIY-YIG nuclease family protein [Chloroflexota bacterium]
MEQFCARWGCNKSATYEKPLCYEHWLEWEAWELDECNRCHYFYENGNFVLYDMPDDGIIKEYPSMCDDCLQVTLLDDGRDGPWSGSKPERKPVIAHADIERPIRYVYILKLSDGTFYVGQTNNLGIRLQEHKDGQQAQTKGKDPKMVYYQSFEGMRKSVDEREIELTILNSNGTGRRKLRQVIEKFRSPLKLLDLEI